MMVVATGAADALHGVHGCGGDRDDSLGDGGVGSADGWNGDGLIRP
jgi:hypothetical protein